MKVRIFLVLCIAAMVLLAIWDKVHIVWRW